MHYTSMFEHKTTGKPSAIRLLALTLCILFIACAIYSTAYVHIHANHRHDHLGPDGSCVTCVHLTLAVNLYKHLSNALVGTMIIFGCSSAICPILRFAGCHIGFLTLVRLKVRLND